MRLSFLIKIILILSLFGTIYYVANAKKISLGGISNHPISDNIKFLNSKERANYKSDVLSIIIPKGVFAEKDIFVEVKDVKKIEGGIQIYARAWQGSQQLGFGKDGEIDIERFRIFNPPILVEDPTGDIVSTSTNPLGVLRTRILKENPLEAIKKTLADTIRISGKLGTNIKIDSIGNTTDTFYPAAGANSPVDGETRRAAGSESWASIHDGAGSTASPSGVNLSIFMDARGASNTFSDLRRGVFEFDTSSIPDTDTVSAATFSYWVTGIYTDATLNQSISLISSSPASDSNLVASDYNVASWGTTRYATDLPISSVINNNYNDFAMNATGKAFISLTGITRLGLRFSGDVDNSAPTWANSFTGTDLYYADQTGTANDPKLVVTHSAPTNPPSQVSDFMTFE